MKSKLVCFVLFFLSTFKQRQYTSGARDVCESKEVLTVIKTSSFVIAQEVVSTSLNVVEKCTNAKQILDFDKEAEKTSLIFLILQNMLSTLQTTETCTQNAQSNYKTLLEQANEMYQKCNSQSKSNQVLLTEKIDSTKKWAQSLNVAFGIDLQKCAMKNIYAGCAALKGCCLNSIADRTHQISEYANSSAEAIQHISSKAIACFDKVLEEILDIEKRVQEGILQCSFMEAEALAAQELQQNSPE